MKKLTRKKNPKDYDLLKQLVVKRNNGVGYLLYITYLSKLEIAKLHFNKNKNYVYNIEVKEEFRRKGVADFLYNYIEKDLDIKLKPSSFLLSDGKAFWEHRLKQFSTYRGWTIDRLNEIYSGDGYLLIFKRDNRTKIVTSLDEAIKYIDDYMGSE